MALSFSALGAALHPTSIGHNVAVENPNMRRRSGTHDEGRGRGDCHLRDSICFINL